MNRQLKADLVCIFAVLWWVLSGLATSASAQVGSELWYNSSGVCAGVTPDPDGGISRNFTVHKANACISITARTDAALAILDAEPRCQGNMTGPTCLLTDNSYWERSASYSDGHVYWDLVSQRWYIIELNEDTGHVQVGFSPGDNPLSMYVTDVIPPPDNVPDYPQLGFNAKWLELSVQLHGGQYTSIEYVWSKTDTFTNGLSATPLITHPRQNENGYTLPCEGQSASFGGLWMVRSWGGWWNHSMQLASITGPEGAPVWNEYAGTPQANFSWHEFDRNSVSQQPSGGPPVPNGPKVMKAIQCIQQGGPNGPTLYFTNTGEVPVAPNVLAANPPLQPRVVEVDDSEGDGITEGNVGGFMELGTPTGQTDQKRGGDMMFAILSPGGGYGGPPVIDGNDGFTRDYHQAFFDTGSSVSEAYDNQGNILTASMAMSPFPVDPILANGANHVDIDTTGLQAGQEMTGTLVTVRNANQNPWFYQTANEVMHSAPTQGSDNSFVVALQDNTPNTVGLYALLGSPIEKGNPIYGCPDETSLDYINIGWNSGLQTPSVWLGNTQFPGGLADPPLILQTPFNIPSGNNYLWAQQYIPSDSCFSANTVFPDENTGITIPLYAADLWATFFWQVPINNVNGTFNVGTYGAGYSASGDPNQGGFTNTTDPFLGVDASGNQVIGFGRIAPWINYGIAWARVAAGTPYPGVSAFQFVKGTLQAYNRTGDYCHGGWEPSAGLYWFCAAETSPSSVGWQVYGDWGI